MFIVYWLRVGCIDNLLSGIAGFMFIFSLQDLKRIKKKKNPYSSFSVVL